MSETKTIPSNVPEFSVGELAFSLKKTLEENYSRVRVRGELSRVSIAGSGHMYSSLKDDQAVIDAVCWKGVMAGLSIKPEEGLEVIVTGRISTYPARSNYQLIIESMELAGEGALLKMLEERKKKLAAEGLFDAERKKRLPFLPDVIGVVTSPTGAVIRDILHRLSDRFPRHVIVWPVLVQGEGAAAQVTAAIEGFQTIDQHGLKRLDLIIVARGGGSLEDLMPFNEENVVRAAAACTIPLISAVGHETDTTLIDYAADLRAPTPTGAAEMAVPRRSDLLAQILDDEKRMMNAASRLTREYQSRLETLESKLGDPRKLLDIHVQKIDHIGQRLDGLFKHYLSEKREMFTGIFSRLRRPSERLDSAAKDLRRWADQLENAAAKITKEPQQKLSHAAQMLEAYSFENVLARGYAVVQNAEGALISDPAQTQDGQKIKIRFKEKKIVKATIGHNGSAPTRKKKSSAAKTEQQSLF